MNGKSDRTITLTAPFWVLFLLPGLFLLFHKLLRWNVQSIHELIQHLDQKKTSFLAHISWKKTCSVPGSNLHYLVFFIEAVWLIVSFNSEALFPWLNSKYFTEMFCFFYVRVIPFLFDQSFLEFSAVIHFDRVITYSTAE